MLLIFCGKEAVWGQFSYFLSVKIRLPPISGNLTFLLLANKLILIFPKKKTRAIGRLVPPTLSSNVFSQSRLASNQRLMNQIGNLVTLQVGENQNWIKLGQENTQTQES